MDPNATLNILRAMQDLDEEHFNIDDFKYLFDVLDEWLSNGGALPKCWAIKRNEKSKAKKS